MIESPGGGLKPAELDIQETENPHHKGKHRKPRGSLPGYRKSPGKLRGLGTTVATFAVFVAISTQEDSRIEKGSDAARNTLAGISARPGFETDVKTRFDESLRMFGILFKDANSSNKRTVRNGPGELIEFVELPDGYIAMEKVYNPQDPNVNPSVSLQVGKAAESSMVTFIPFPSSPWADLRVSSTYNDISGISMNTQLEYGGPDTPLSVFSAVTNGEKPTEKDSKSLENVFIVFNKILIP